MKRRPIAKSVEIALDAEHHVALADLKNGILALLGSWIAYFLIINAFIDRLDRVTIPVVDLPLGAFLVIQGTVVMFAGALYLLLKRQHT